MPAPITPFTLEGRLVRLEPLRPELAPQLLAAGLIDRATFGLTGVPDSLEASQAYIHSAIQAREAGLAMPFATVRRSDDRVIGSTRFGNLEYWPWAAGNPHAKTDGTPDAAEIGWTWLEPGAQRSGINTEAKRLMLEHAFETWRVLRMTFKTDARNTRSRNAIERLGAKFDGVLRSHVPAADGGIRDSAYYSIIAAEWPEVRARLDGMLEVHAQARG
jgi:N-acetyltransferase